MAGDPPVFGFGPQGWTCPKCGRVYAPFISECYACNQAATYSVPTTTPPDYACTCGTSLMCPLHNANSAKEQE